MQLIRIRFRYSVGETPDCLRKDVENPVAVPNPTCLAICSTGISVSASKWAA